MINILSASKQTYLIHFFISFLFFIFQTICYITLIEGSALDLLLTFFYWKSIKMIQIDKKQRFFYILLQTTYLMILFSVLLLFYVFSVQTSTILTCPTHNKVPNLLQENKYLQILTGRKKLPNSYNSYVVWFSASDFDKKPTALVSIKNYNCDRFTEINYNIDTYVNSTSAQIIFTSSLMDWINIQVVIWLTSRPDISISSFSKNDLKPGLTNITNIFNHNFNFSETIFVNFINCLSASSIKSIYQINTYVPRRTKFSVSLAITIGAFTSVKYIKIVYVVYSVKDTICNPDYGYLASNLLTKFPIYIKVVNNYSPISYSMLGFDMINLIKERSMIIRMNFDKDNILQISTDKKVDHIRAVYLTIGVYSSFNCSLCGKGYFYEGKCYQKCPSNTYPFTKNSSQGGGYCLTCSTKVYETINNRNTGCKCIQGYQRLKSDHACIPTLTNKDILTSDKQQDKNSNDIQNVVGQVQKEMSIRSAIQIEQQQKAKEEQKLRKKKEDQKSSVTITSSDKNIYIFPIQNGEDIYSEDHNLPVIIKILPSTQNQMYDNLTQKQKQSQSLGPYNDEAPSIQVVPLQGPEQTLADINTTVISTKTINFNNTITNTTPLSNTTATVNSSGIKIINTNTSQNKISGQNNDGSTVEVNKQKIMIDNNSNIEKKQNITYLIKNNTPNKSVQLNKCGNMILQNQQQCDDGNNINGDGCSQNCLVENGYICNKTTCLQTLLKMQDSISSLGVIITFRYVISKIAYNTNFISVQVIDKTHNISQNSITKIMRPQNDKTLLYVVFVYQGTIPCDYITLLLISKSPLGDVSYACDYDLVSKKSLPRQTINTIAQLTSNTTKQEQKNPQKIQLVQISN